MGYHTTSIHQLVVVHMNNLINFMYITTTTQCHYGCATLTAGGEHSLVTCLACCK